MATSSSGGSSASTDAPLSHAEMADALVSRFGEVIRWVPDLRKGEFVYFDRRWRGEPGCHAHVVSMLGNAIVRQARMLQLTPRQSQAMKSSTYRRDVLNTVVDLYEETLHRPLERWDENAEE